MNSVQQHHYRFAYSNLLVRCNGILILAIVLALHLSVFSVQADTIVFKDGTIVEGKILKESSKYVKIQTKYGKKSYRLSEIDRIVKESDANSALKAIEEEKDFEKLSDIARALKNAQALYDLGRFDEIADVLAPFDGKGTKFDNMCIRWALIDAHERKGEWKKAEKLLKQTLEDGREPDKIRAKAHLDIFEQNPGYTLRVIDIVERRRSKEFLSKDMRNQGKRKNALQSKKMMEAALLEYQDQILKNEKASVYALASEMNLDETYRIIVEENKKERPQSPIKILPYLDMLKEVEKSIQKVHSISPGYASDFELELARVEADHLYKVIYSLLADVTPLYPDNLGIIPDSTGKLSSGDRERWREACDRFLKETEPIVELIEYLLERVKPHPVELMPFIKEWQDTLERVQQMRQNTVRNYNRT